MTLEEQRQAAIRRDQEYLDKELGPRGPAYIWQARQMARADKKKPYLDPDRPLTGVPANYVNATDEPRYEVHSDNRSFKQTMVRIGRCLGNVYTYANGRIENINLEKAIKDIRGMDEIPD